MLVDEAREAEACGLPLPHADFIFDVSKDSVYYLTFVHVSRAVSSLCPPPDFDYFILCFRDYRSSRSFLLTGYDDTLVGSHILSLRLCVTIRAASVYIVL